MLEITLPTAEQGSGGSFETAGTVVVLPVQIYDGAGNTPTIVNGGIPVYSVGGTVQTTVSFSGTLDANIGNVKLEDAVGNLAELPSANVAKTGGNKALLVQQLDETGATLRQSTLVAIMNNQGTLAEHTDLHQVRDGVNVVANNQGTLASVYSVAAVVNSFGTLATQATLAQAAASLVAIENTGTATRTAVANLSLSSTASLNHQGTLATSALQTTGNTTLENISAAVTATMNAAGTQASAVAGVSVIANNQGTQATAALQTTGNALLGDISAAATAILNNQGTQANNNTLATTNLYLAAGNTIASATLNNQGTQATAALQTTGNTILGNISAATTALMNTQGSLATAVGASSSANSFGTLVDRNLFAQVVTTVGATGTTAPAYLNCKTSFNDSVAVDAFNRLRIAAPDYRFDGQLTNKINTDVWDLAFTVANSGTVTYDPTDRLAKLNVFTSGSAVMQSHYHIPYTPGRSQLAFTTFSFGTTPASGAVRRVGYFDDSSGIFLEHANTGLTLNIRSSTNLGNQSVAQSAWNIDKLDGTGPSGIVLDLTKVQIFVVQLQALYVGRVVCAFDIDGVVVPVHAFRHANRVAYPYIQQASLPVRWEVRSTTTGVGMSGICASVISEGGGSLIDMPGRTFGASSGSAETAVTTRRPLLSIRVMKLLNGLQFDGIVLPTSIAASSRTQPSFIELIRNPTTLTTPTWTAVNSSESGVEFDTAATAITGGSLIWSNYCTTNSGITVPISQNMLSRLVITYSHLLEQTDILTVVATSLNATANISVALNWKEIR